MYPDPVFATEGKESGPESALIIMLCNPVQATLGHKGCAPLGVQTPCHMVTVKVKTQIAMQ